MLGACWRTSCVGCCRQQIKKNAVWNMFTLTSIAERATRVLVRDDFYEFVATSTSRYEQVAYSLLYMFNNRKKDHSLWSYFVRCLNILTLCMNDIVLNRRVGQGSPDIRAPPKRKKLRAPPPFFPLQNACIGARIDIEDVSNAATA